jgi:hypothetical protein
MSRTYRRNKEKAPEWVTRDWDNWSWGEAIHPPDLTGKAAQREVSKWHSDSGWHGNYSECPKWFNKLYHIIPERREAKRLQRKVLRLDDYEDSPEFPLVHERTEYYW